MSPFIFNVYFSFPNVEQVGCGTVSVTQMSAFLDSLFMLWLKRDCKLSNLRLPSTYKPEASESAHTPAASGCGTDLPVAPTVSLGT